MRQEARLGIVSAMGKLWLCPPPATYHHTLATTRSNGPTPVPDTPHQTEQPPPTSKASSAKARWKVLLLLAAIGCFAVAFMLLPVSDYLGYFLASIESLGVWGPVLFVLVYAVATVAMVPGLVLTLASGFVFGVVIGSVVVSAGSMLGATAAFLVGRNFAREYVEGLTRKFPKFAAIDRAVEQAGFKIVLLTRLSPAFPFNVINYLYGATRVTLKNYLVASWIGMLPGTIMYVYLGTVAKSLTDLLAGKAEVGIAAKVLQWVGLLATIVVTVYVTKVAGQAIRQYVPDKQDDRPA